MDNTPKGHMIPQTVESLQAVMAADAVTMQRMDAEVKKLRARNNKLAQKLAKVRRISTPDNPLLETARTARTLGGYYSPSELRTW
jgi:hypothetical protein